MMMFLYFDVPEKLFEKEIYYLCTTTARNLQSQQLLFFLNTTVQRKQKNTNSVS